MAWVHRDASRKSVTNGFLSPPRDSHRIECWTTSSLSFRNSPCSEETADQPCCPVCPTRVGVRQAVAPRACAREEARRASRPASVRAAERRRRRRRRLRAADGRCAFPLCRSSDRVVPCARPVRPSASAKHTRRPFLSRLASPATPRPPTHHGSRHFGRHRHRLSSLFWRTGIRARRGKRSRRSIRCGWDGHDCLFFSFPCRLSPRAMRRSIQKNHAGKGGQIVHTVGN